jgi:hypothetical protein
VEAIPASCVRYYGAVLVITQVINPRRGSVRPGDYEFGSILGKFPIVQVYHLVSFDYDLDFNELFSKVR